MKILIALGLLSLVVLAAPGLGSIAAITIIGFPLALAYWFTPAAFLILLLAYGIFRFLKLSGKVGGAIAVIVSLTVFAIPPYVLNGPIQAGATAAIQGDLDRIQTPLTPKTIASRERFNFSRNVPKCDGLCLHALLSGAAESFLVVETKTPHAQLTDETEAIAFRFEQRETCPPMPFKPGFHTLKLPIQPGSRRRTADPVEMVKLRAVEGQCLVSAPATLGAADLVISRGKLSPDIYRHTRFAFKLFADTVLAERVSIHKRSASGEFEEIFRNTEVRYHPFAPLLVPFIASNNLWNLEMGWWRHETTLNIDDRYDDPMQWGKFLTGKLDLNLALEGEDTRRKTQQKLESLLDAGTPPSAPDWELFSRYFDRMGIDHNANMTQLDFDLGMQLLANPGFPAPPRLHELIQFAKRNGNESRLAHMAGLLLDRLQNAGGQYESLNERAGDQVRRISLGIRRLPQQALRPHKNTLFVLAQDPTIQEHGQYTLKQLAIFGEEAVPALLELTRFGATPRKQFMKNPRYQHGYLAGLQGLCDAGRQARSGLSQLRQMTEAKKLPEFGAYGNLLYVTLLRLGEDRKRVFDLYLAAEKRDASAAENNFRQLEKRATKARQPCYV